LDKTRGVNPPESVAQPRQKIRGDLWLNHDKKIRGDPWLNQDKRSAAIRG
jgi:hypothetical protein